MSYATVHRTEIPVEQRALIQVFADFLEIYLKGHNRIFFKNIWKGYTHEFCTPSGLKIFEAKYLCFSKCGLMNQKLEIYDYFLMWTEESLRL